MHAFWDITLCHWASSSWHFEGTIILQSIRTTCQRTQCHTPDKLHIQQHCCENHKSCNMLLLMTFFCTAQCTICIQNRKWWQYLLLRHCSQECGIWYAERPFVRNSYFQMLKVTNMVLEYSEVTFGNPYVEEWYSSGQYAQKYITELYNYSFITTDSLSYTWNHL